MIKVIPSGVRNKPFMVAKNSKIVLSNGDIMCIPKGYPTDYASVPKILKFFLEYVGREADGYIVHDYLYNFRGYRTSFRSLKHTPVTRKFADKEMAYQMKQLHSPKWRIFTYYIAVRLFGWLGFGRI